MELPENPPNFLPNLCGIRFVFSLVLGVELLCVVLTLAADVPLAGFWDSFSLYSLHAQWVALGTTALGCLVRPLWQSLDNRSAGLLLWGLGVVVVAAVTLASFSLGGPLLGDQPFWSLLIKSTGITAVVAAMVLRYLYEQHCQQQQERAESQARFDALQARIRPHFLFNSMNTIANLTRADPALAEEVVQDLSDLFRASLSGSGALSSLDDELALARGYLRIERQRLGDRLKVEWDLQELPGQALLPPLVLQPLLENAVYHGIEPATAGGEILVSGRYRKGVVNLSVRNSLPGHAQASERQGNRMALDNIRARLQAAFGEEAGLVVGRVEDHYQVRLYFPLKESRS